MKIPFGILLKYLAVFAIFSILLIALFHIPALRVTGAYFFDGILLVIIVAAILTVSVSFFRKRLMFDMKDIAISLLLFLTLNLLWFSVCVVALDRSLSVFLLCYMETNEAGYTEGEIEEVFQDVFIEKYDMLGRRFDEQVLSGNIELMDDKYKLTSRGEFFVRTFQIVGKAYGVDQRFIYPDKQ